MTYVCAANKVFNTAMFARDLQLARTERNEEYLAQVFSKKPDEENKLLMNTEIKLYLIDSVCCYTTSELARYEAELRIP